MISFGSTDCTTADFTATNLAAGVTGVFKITGNTLVFITGTPPVPIETWRQSFFGPTATNTGNAANLADPDNDGRTNLYEYALGTNPTLPNPTTHPVGGHGGNFMTLQFPRNPAATDVTLTILTSTDLQPVNWTTLATWTDATGWINAPGTTLTETAGVVNFTDSGDLTNIGIQRRFLQLRVTTP